MQGLEVVQRQSNDTKAAIIDRIVYWVLDPGLSDPVVTMGG